MSMEVAAMRSGAQLAAWVEGLDPGCLDAAGLADAVAACTRLESWVTARRAELMVQFENAAQSSGSSTFAHAELACVLRWPEKATLEHLEQARVLVEQMPETMRAWSGGTISAKHATAVADVVAASALDPDAVAGVEAKVLEQAGTQTVAQLRRVAHAAVDRADADAAQRRHEERRALRAVRVCPQPDGMSMLRADLDAPTALVLYGQVTSYADTLRATDPTLTMDQARADALVGLVDTGFNALTNTPAGAPVGSTDTPVPAARVEIQVTVDWKVLAGLAQDPAHLHGHGPITAHQARTLAHSPHATWRRLLTDPADPTNLNLGRQRYRPPVDLADHVRAANPECLFPTCTQPAQRCQLDHNQPYGNPDGTGPGGDTSATNLGPLCKFQCAVRRSVVSPVQPGLTRRRLVGHPAYLEPKGEGDHSMPGKRCPSGGVRGGVARGPCDMAKAGLLEAQSPVVKCSTRRNDA